MGNTCNRIRVYAVKIKSGIKIHIHPVAEDAVDNPIINIENGIQVAENDLAAKIDEIIKATGRKEKHLSIYNVSMRDMMPIFMLTKSSGHLLTKQGRLYIDPEVYDIETVTKQLNNSDEYFCYTNEIGKKTVVCLM